MWDLPGSPRAPDRPPPVGIQVQCPRTFAGSSRSRRRLAACVAADTRYRRPSALRCSTSIPRSPRQRDHRTRRRWAWRAWRCCSASRPPWCCSACSPCGCRSAWACRRCCSTWASASCSASPCWASGSPTPGSPRRPGSGRSSSSSPRAASPRAGPRCGRALRVGIALSTVSVVVSIAVVGTALHVALGLDWRTAFLWGAVLSSTDAAAVFSVLRGVGVSRRLRGVARAGVGDERRAGGARRRPARLGRPDHLADPDPRGLRAPGGCGHRVRAGPGGSVGAAARRAARRPACTRSPRSPSACSPTRAGMLAHASGLLATYVAALVLGNSNLPHRGDVLSFVEGTGWLAQIGLFVLLGLYASPPRLVDAVVPALIAGVVLVVAARPLSVVAAAAPFRVPWREQAFLSWSGLRGAVPIVLALVALQEGAPNAQRLVDAVFVLVVVLTLLQGTTLPFVARRLGVVASRAARDRGRRRPAGRAGRRPAAGPGAGGLPAARGLPARAAAAARRDGEPGRARRGGVHPDGRHPAARGRPAPGRHHGRGARGHRAADPGGRPGRAAGPLARRVRPPEG